MWFFLGSKFYSLFWRLGYSQQWDRHFISLENCTVNTCLHKAEGDKYQNQQKTPQTCQILSLSPRSFSCPTQNRVWEWSKKTLLEVLFLNTQYSKMEDSAAKLITCLPLTDVIINIFYYFLLDWSYSLFLHWRLAICEWIPTSCQCEKGFSRSQWNQNGFHRWQKWWLCLLSSKLVWDINTIYLQAGSSTI